MAIKNIVLDMGNVLLSWEPEAFSRRAAGNEEDAAVLNSALFDTPEWILKDAGQIDDGEVLRISLARTPERLHDTLRALFAQWPGWMAPIPGAEAFTRKVKEAGLKLYLLSNAGKRFPRAMEKQPFYPRFDGMMVSAHEKVAKPDPRIYQRLYERFSLLPGECLFVDDMAANVEAAERTGMAAHLFDGDYRKVEDRLRALGCVLGGTSRA